jgi:hypothetical protein
MDPREELEALRRLAELEAKQRMPEPAAAADPTGGMTGPERILAGIGKGFAEPDVASGKCSA